jgi:hypothetical protein
VGNTIKIVEWLRMIFGITRTKDILPKMQQQKENPYLPKIRFILEQVLEKKRLNYGTMRLMLIDTDSPPESMLDEDDMELVLAPLSEDLNYLTILTNRPGYFQEFVERMYLEAGLIVELDIKGKSKRYNVNTILDFEQEGSLYTELLGESVVYISIYKMDWESKGELDICVPIGYNTVIVRGI